jgi:hypothetical protein
MQATKTNTLRVPGANLYDEVRGSGPVLLLICGGSTTPLRIQAWLRSSPIGTRC